MTSETGEAYSVTPIGRVVSPVGEGDEMPIDGVPASIEVFPEYEAGLAGIESNTHLIILGWFHKADRSGLTLSRHGGRGRGVFGLRSPGRPNPIGLTSARVLGVEGRVVRLDRLDMIDGTPIVDIKRYSPGWDSIFSARTSRDTEHLGDREPGVVPAGHTFRGRELSRGEVRGRGPRGADGGPCDIPLGHREEGVRIAGWVGPRRLHQRRFASHNRRNLRQRAVGRGWKNRLRGVVGG